MTQQGDWRLHRIALAALVALALVGMHHLVVTGCQVATSAAITTLDASHAGHASSTPAPHDGADGPASNDLALMCLAIMGAVILIAVHGLVTRDLRRRDRDIIHTESSDATVPRPPDLFALSILRT